MSSQSREEIVEAISESGKRRDVLIQHLKGPAIGSTPLTCQPFNLLPPPFHITIFQGRDFPFIKVLSARLTFLLNPVSPIFISSRIFTVQHKGLLTP